MLRDLEKNFEQLEASILKINKDYIGLSKKYGNLVEKYTQLKERYEAEKESNLKLLEEQKRIKMMAAISGNPEHNKLMKNHINRLIKEIDACIIQLQNTGM